MARSRKPNKPSRRRLLLLVPEIKLHANHEPGAVIKCDLPYWGEQLPNPVADLKRFAEVFRAVWHQLPHDARTPIAENWPGGRRGEPDLPGKPGQPMIVVQPGKLMPLGLLSSSQGNWSYWFSALMLLPDDPDMRMDDNPALDRYMRKLLGFYRSCLPYEIVIQLAFAYREAVGASDGLLTALTQGGSDPSELDGIFREYRAKNTKSAVALARSWGFTRPRMPRVPAAD